MPTQSPVFNVMPKGYVTLKETAAILKCKVRTIQKGIEYKMIASARAYGLGQGPARVIIPTADIPKIKKNISKIRERINTELSQYKVPSVDAITEISPRNQKILNAILELAAKLD